ncbi:expressed unknown protein [Seminavis robusta]|uniref:Uncharacterized protein n=1 Tax=Seminavis robusta TaxID=568900 RepID=A0A9N8DC95_9STRA|nr:expressed unknown protein [Seminavis robusta]|eukprot:Sro57_g033080.1 n/a (362) ;mRNA; f:793-1878
MKFPEIVLPVSSSNCSLDVSVLSMGSSCDSCSSFSSMDPPPRRKPSQDRLTAGMQVHRRRKSNVKFNFKGTNKSRWTNNMEAISSAGMTSVPFRKPSNPGLVHMHHAPNRQSDIAANLPCRKCSDPRLYKLVVDAPASAPTRKFSNPTPLFHLGGLRSSPQQGKAATAALNQAFNNSGSSLSSSGSSSANSNFRWKTGSQFCAHPPLRSTNPLRGKAQPPSRPNRKGSLMDFNILSSWDVSPCQCPHDDIRHTSITEGLDNSEHSTDSMPPPLPARKESLMDFDDALSTAANSGCGHFHPSPRTQVRRFVQHNLQKSMPSVPLRRGSIMPPPPEFARQVSSASSAPVIPARQESLMDLNDL